MDQAWKKGALVLALCAAWGILAGAQAGLKCNRSEVLAYLVAQPKASAQAYVGFVVASYTWTDARLAQVPLNQISGKLCSKEAVDWLSTQRVNAGDFVKNQIEYENGLLSSAHYTPKGYKDTQWVPMTKEQVEKLPEPLFVLGVLKVTSPDGGWPIRYNVIPKKRLSMSWQNFIRDHVAKNVRWSPINIGSFGF